MKDCADCGRPVGQDEGPPDGWQLEDGRTVCHACCGQDTARFIRMAIELGKAERGVLQ